MFEDLEATIPPVMAELKVPGCAVALIEDGRPKLVRCFGTSDRESGAPVTPHTRFSLQSVSKSVAAWTAMRLVEQGRLDLDAPISRYLKRWTLPPSAAFDLDAVTARRLLTHTAGITVAGFRGVALDQTEYTLIDAMTGRLPPASPAFERHYAYWNLPPDDPLVTVTHPPGGEWRYSNAGFGILELAMEDITGERYADLAERSVLRPLGMQDASFARRDGVPPDARPHGRDGQPVDDHRWICAAAAGVYASIRELAIFTSAASSAGGEVAGRGVLTPASLGAMHTAHGPADTSSGAPFEAGLGCVVLRAGGLLNIHHSGGSVGWRSIYSVFPDLGAGICMLMNSEAANELWVPLVRRWRDAVVGAQGA